MDFFEINKGNQEVVIADAFSRLIMTRVTAGERSEDAKQALEKWIFCFGKPEVLVTDNG